MTKKEAIELLKHHSFTHDNHSHSKSEKGFLGMLRPFKGELIESNFHELMNVLKTLKGQFEQECIDRELISKFWSICQLSKSWGIERNGMLRSNNLISKKQVETLSDWVDCISYTIMNLLEGVSEKVAFEHYNYNFTDKK